MARSPDPAMYHYKDHNKSIPHSTFYLMDKIAQICISGGAVSLGGDPGSTVIEACIVYKGQTYTGSISREALHHSKQQVLDTCNEILEKIISEPAQPKSHRSDFEALDRMDAMKMAGAHFDGEKFTPMTEEEIRSLQGFNNLSVENQKALLAEAKN